MEGHPAGWLAIQHRITCLLLAAEDATQAADYQRMPQLWFATTTERAATATERTLLTALGHVPPEDLVTVVDYVTDSVRRRTWPSLETDE